MDEALKHKLLAMVEKMPAFPQSVNKVIELTSDIECSPKQLVQVIEHDPVMTMKMLKLVNSAHFGLLNHISTIQHAVIYLGLNTVKNMALSIATVGMLKKFTSPWFNSHDFLLHSLLVATIARKLGEMRKFDNNDSTDLFIAGLLHDFGKVVFIQFMKDEFYKALEMAQEQGIALHQAETQVMGVNHAEMGSILAAYWGLPKALITSIQYHHHLEEGANDLCEYVFVANQVVKYLNLGGAGNAVVEDFSAAMLASFGSLESIVEDLGDMTDEIEKAHHFMNL